MDARNEGSHPARARRVSVASHILGELARRFPAPASACAGASGALQRRPVSTALLQPMGAGERLGFDSPLLTRRPAGRRLG